MPTFTSLTLPLAIGIIDILLGTAILVLPISPTWYPIALQQSLSPAYGTSFVFFGVISFILHVTRGALPRTWRVLGSMIIVIPLIAAAWSAFSLGALVGGVALVALAAVGIVFGGLPGSEESRGPTVDALVVTVFTLEVAVGLLLFTAPHTFRSPPFRDLIPYRAVLAAILLGGGGVLAAAMAGRISRPALPYAGYVAPAVPLLILTVASVRGADWWPGVFVFPVLAGFLIAHPWLERALVTSDRAGADGPAAAAFERAAEGVVWAVILLVTIAGNMQQAAANRVTLHALAFVASLFTLVWFRLPRPHMRERMLWGTVIYTGLAGLVMHLTGGLRTPLLFLLFLPVLAAAWALPPQYIGVAAGIGIASLAIEFGWEVWQGVAIAEAAPVAVFQMAGLLFVAVFTYLLARRAAGHRALLRLEKEKLETIVASMWEGLLVLDQAGKIQFCNRAAERMLACRDAEVVGRPLLEVLSVQREDEVAWRDGEHPVLQALRGGQARRQRVLLRRGDAAPVPVALAVTPVFEAGGRPSGAICSLQDVAAEVEMERMREDFFYIASHEIRTPLTVIKGNVELALDGSLGTLGDRVRHVLAEIHDATGRLIRLVNGFLDAARVEQGKISLQIDRGSLPALVERAIAILAPDATRKGLTLTYRLPGPSAVPTVLMDAETTLQILLNLVGNSIKFTQRGGVEIWHEVRDGLVETHVKDTGVGIPADQRHRLFERFSQMQRGLRREPGGSGLGLYISRKLAEHMHGAVFLQESVPDGGSTFVFSLPMASEVQKPQAGAASRAKTGTR